MNRLLACACMTVLLALGGCKSKHESVLDDMIDCTQDAVDVLKGVKDEASAQAAAVELKKITDRMQTIQKEMQGMKDPPEAEQKRLMEKFKPKMEQVQKDLRTEMERINKDPKLAQHVREAVWKLR